MTELQRVDLHRIAHHLENLLALQKFLCQREKTEVLELLYPLQNKLHEELADQITD